MSNRVFSVILGLSFVVGCFAQLPVIFDSCIVCSSATNITCAINPDSQRRTACTTLITGAGCYTRIIDGHTLRGCANELDEGVVSECNHENCSVCRGIAFEPVFGCNNQIFPEHRRQCHQCSGPVNGTCDDAPRELATVCEMFDVADRCYIQRTSTTITRGCISSRGTNCQNVNHCLICEFNGCNNDHGSVPIIPIAPGSAATNQISIVMLSTAFIFALTQFI